MLRKALSTTRTTALTRQFSTCAESVANMMANSRYKESVEKLADKINDFHIERGYRFTTDQNFKTATMLAVISKKSEEEIDSLKEELKKTRMEVSALKGQIAALADPIKKLSLSTSWTCLYPAQNKNDSELEIIKKMTIEQMSSPKNRGN